MKTIMNNELALIEGGSSATEFGDGFCIGVGLFGWAAGPVGVGLGIGCGIYALWRIT